MKKIIALAVAAVAAVAVASADPLLIGHGYFGVGLGSTVTDSNGKALDKDLTSWNFGSNLDFGAGIGINIPFGGYFGFQPGVDFYVNNVGYHAEGTVLLLGTTKADYTFNYLSLDIPLLFTAKVNKWNFALGPYVSIPLGDVAATTKGTINNLSYDNSENPDKLAHSWGSVGLEVGVGYEQRMGMGRLVIGGNYMLDFIPIEVGTKNSEGKFVAANKFTRRALKLDVTYKLPLSF